MSEIKHNFMKGKMNKDLDERLVPNGEYRDALNIQVSTSEGSDVGTVQNILGNSLLAGQAFISENAVCVGSIADEKNDKLYYFVIDNSTELIQDPELTDNTIWNVSGGNTVDFSGIGALITSPGTGTDNYPQFYNPIVDLVDGQTYQVTVKFSEISQGGSGGSAIKAFVYGPPSAGGANGYRPYYDTNVTSGTHVSTFTFDQSQNNGVPTMRFSVELTNGDDFVKTIRVESVSLTTNDLNCIIEYDSKTNTITPVFVDTSGDVLRFDENNIITGINIIDNLLLWTDSVNEPKKINIDRCKEGTDKSGEVHTNLVVKGDSQGLIKEEHITVIKRSPAKAPGLTTKTHGRAGYTSGNLKQVNYFHPSGNGGAAVVDGDSMWIAMPKKNVVSFGTGYGPKLYTGDILRVYKGHGKYDSDQAPIARLLVKEKGPSEMLFPQAQNNFSETAAVAYSHERPYRVSVSTFVEHTSGDKYFWELEEAEEGIFERKFPRFAYRYKYEDNEFSPVGPFTEVVFLPGEFSYHPTKAYNEGMINHLKELTLKDFVQPDMPSNVVGIDLLYKNEFSPNVYVVKSIDKDSDEWNNNEYVIKTENVYAQLPSDQLIRPWDNVPRMALAQEITGNRVIYGNYTQGYNLTDTNGDTITPTLKATLDERLNPASVNVPSRSLKSQRTYNFGVVYGDKYGRETPVFTNANASRYIAKSSSATSNSIVANLSSEHPEWAEYYKIFVKETANEYYNLAMGRAYDAEDGNVWISFPSADRNKVDEDTYLILKKAVGENIKSAGGVVIDEARYKVVAIENEAPLFLKTEYTLLAEVTKRIQASSLFGGHYLADWKIEAPAEAPFPGKSTFTLDKQWWRKKGSENWKLGLPDLEDLWLDNKTKGDIYVSFSNTHKMSNTSYKDSPIQMSQRYKVTSITSLDESTAHDGYAGHALYRVAMAETVPHSEGYLTEDIATGNEAISKYYAGGKLRPHFYKKEVLQKPEFDGRFFVKVIEDETLAKAIRVDRTVGENGFQITSPSINLFHIKDGTASGESGQTASITKAHWESNLGGAEQSKWFVDEAAFAGVQPSNHSHPKNSITTNDGTALCDVSTPTYFAHFELGTASSGEFNSPYLEEKLQSYGHGGGTGLKLLKGAHDATYDTSASGLGDESNSGYTAPSGATTDGHYLHLSYGGINPRPNPSFSPQIPTDDHFTAMWYRNYYWNQYGYNKNWNIGKYSWADNLFGGTNAGTDDQEEIVKNLSYGKMFRFSGSDTVYMITQVRKRRLYNYMGNLNWNSDNNLRALDPQYWANNVNTNNQSNYSDFHHLGGYDTSGNWYDASFVSPSQNSMPSEIVNVINPMDLTGIVYTANQADNPSGDNVQWDTGANHQHRNMTDPMNCRVNFLVKYKVVFDEGPEYDPADATVRLWPENITEDNSFDNMSTTIFERLEFVKESTTQTGAPLTSHPAIFETEPKEDVGLDIYYEASNRKPIKLRPNNIHNLAHIGAMISTGVHGSETLNFDGVFASNITQIAHEDNEWRIALSAQVNLLNLGDIGSEIRLWNDDGSYAIATLVSTQAQTAGEWTIVDGEEVYIPGDDEYTREDIDAVSSIFVSFIPNKVGLGWFNCWSFGNGVESNRIGDTYNKPYITNGVKASTTLLDSYREEHRKYGLIYSGIYNSTSGVNNLNQFIAAEKITKDINPNYGSIQKLHSRSSADGDLITLCEDRILKILANKDALYNADGNPQLLATNNVLGQAIPFTGEFGISTNPESFASESYRVYFTDKVRGAVMRLSRDGLTPISDHGMKDWFRDNLKLSTKLVGSYDDRNDEYNITLADKKILGEEMLEGAMLMDSTHWSSSASLSENYVLDFGVVITSDGTTPGDYPTFGHTVDLVDGATYAGSITLDGISHNGISTFLYGYGNSSYRPFSTPYATLNDEYRFEFKFDQASNNNDTTMRLAVQVYQGGSIVKSVRVVRASLKEIISDPTTVSFKEDVKGWVSFKSFVPENALSMANDYYTMLGGKLYKHHVEKITNRNNFYGVDYNSSVNVLLNDIPGSIKSYHTLGYEGSQSRVKGIKSVTIGVDSLTGVNPNDVNEGLYFYFNTKSEMDDLLGYSWDSGVVSTNIKQYRGGILIREGFIYLANTPTTFGLVGRWNEGSTDGDSSAAAEGDWQVGDIITTQLQEDSVSHFNMTPKDGWYVSSIETDKQEGNIHEFIEKEGKWFNYIKGIDSDITSETDFGAFNIQGIGILKQTITSGNFAAFVASNPSAIYGLQLGWDYWNNIMEFDSPINASLQIGDIIYYQQTITSLGGFSAVDPKYIIKFGQVTAKTSHTITVDATFSGQSPQGTADPYHGAFIFFAKNHTINTSSLLGYFADVKFENNSTDKIELFSVGSEITESSK